MRHRTNESIVDGGKRWATVQIWRGPAMHSRLWRLPQGKPGLRVCNVSSAVYTSSVTVSLDRMCRLMLRIEVRRTDSAKYAGSSSCRQWYINTHSRKVIRFDTFSQCSWRSSPVTLSYLLAEQTSLSAELRTDCRRRSCVDDAPAITELQ